MGEASAEWREQKLNELFHRWEVRGRGWQLFDQPVSLEPPFRPFSGHFIPQKRQEDEGRQHTLISRFLSRFEKAQVPAQDEPVPEEDPSPTFSSSDLAVELPLTFAFPKASNGTTLETFIRHVARGGELNAFEMFATEREIVPQFVSTLTAASRLQRAFESCFPGIPITQSGESLSGAWADSESNFAVAELGLGSEFMLPLGNPRCDLLAAVVTAMDGLGEGEFALYQLLFEPVQNAWQDSVLRAVTRQDGGPLFANRPELHGAARQKVASPLFGVVIRLAASARSTGRAWDIMTDLAASLSLLERPGSNYLIPLSNAGYPARDHETDILERQSRRCGMLLNMEELIPLLSPPLTSTSRKLRRELRRTHGVPEMLTDNSGLLLGTNRHAGIDAEVGLLPEHRVRHMHVIGASGFGKSTLLFNLIRQDIERGEGLAVFDPHGDLIDAILGVIPSSRREEVILIDPSDEDYSVGLNILDAHTDVERALLSSDLTSVFRRLSTSWGDQMESVLRNAFLAFLESSRGGTLADLRRFLLDANFRREFLETVTDPEIVYYWSKAFPQLSGGKSIGPLLTRLDEFLSRKPIRYMVSQKENRVDFAEVIDRGRILLVKLPQGLIGRANTALLGSLITAKLQMAAMSRQRMLAAQRRDFWCYMDEFQNFITPSMGEILTGARKYRLGLILAHQELRQLEADRDVASAVLSNSHTRVVFKVGDADARSLEGGFSNFEARDLMNLSTGEAVCRVERSDFDFNLSVPKPLVPDDEDVEKIREDVIAKSRARYSRPRSEIEAELRKQWETQPPTTKPKKKTSREAEGPEVEEIPPKSAAGEEVLESVEESAAVEGPSVASSEAAIATGTSPLIGGSFSSDPGAPVATQDTQGGESSQPKRTLGRGGFDHKTLQALIKSTAGALGFAIETEASVPNTRKGVDVGLRRGNISIGCEISIGSRTTHEVENVLKCLQAGYSHVALVSANEKRLNEVAEVLSQKVSADDFARTGFYSTEAFLEFLRRLADENPEEPPPQPKPGESNVVKKRGWTIRSKAADITDEEAKAADERAFRAIAEALRNKKPE